VRVAAPRVRFSRVCVASPQGFARIQNLDEYTGLKSIFLEGNGLESLDGLQARFAHANAKRECMRVHAASAWV
jgi:hypothetical protein